MQEELKEAVAALAEARKRRTDADADVKYEYQRFEDEIADTLAAQALAQDVCNALERKVRELALEVFDTTGKIDPATGVAIKFFRGIQYDAKDALEWAKEHKLALTLDRKTFEKIAESADLPFVTRTTTPKATVATNLDEALRTQAENATEVQVPA